MALTFNPLRAVMNYSHAKVQGQQSVSSEDRLVMNGWMDRGDCIASHANAVVNQVFFLFWDKLLAMQKNIRHVCPCTLPVLSAYISLWCRLPLRSCIMLCVCFTRIRLLWLFEIPGLEWQGSGASERQQTYQCRTLRLHIMLVVLLIRSTSLRGSSFSVLWNC